ncbi:hypothetical protein Dimus_010273, partial [Dionaea muscipula]
RENGVWWLGIGANRRRYEDEDAPAANEEVNQENNNQAENVELNEKATQEGSFEWEVANEEVHVEGEQVEKKDENDNSGSGEKFYDAVDEERLTDEVVPAPTVLDVAIDKQQEKAKSLGVDPSSSLTDYDQLHL